MNIYALLSIIVTLAVSIAYINYRYIKMQSSIAIMAGSLVISLMFILLDKAGLASFTHFAIEAIEKINFHEFLMNGLLSFLLFAGGLTINISELRQYKMEIAVLASLSTIASAFAIGFTMYYLLPYLGVDLPLLYCLLFGALISPTDPIAVLAMCKSIRAPRSLTTTIAGESLFNDGVGIVLFLSILSLISQQDFSFIAISHLFFQEALGGLVYGFLLGKAIQALMLSVNEINMQILLTLAATTGGYAFANVLDISGPLAMVVAGIIVGNHVSSLAPDQLKLQAQLQHFWEMIDEILNAILFLLLGLELLTFELHLHQIFIGLVAVPMVLLIRLITVATPLKLFSQRRNYPTHFIKIMTWGGLRGGLAVALALSIPPSNFRNIILAMTYIVVIFSVLVQGVTIKPLVKKSTQHGRD